MRTIAALTLALAGIGFGFDAAADQRDVIRQIASEAGVSTRQVQMVLGSRTQFAEYRTSYDRIAPRVEAAARRLAAKEGPDREKFVAIAEQAKL